jgi:hypothetical protein
MAAILILLASCGREAAPAGTAPPATGGAPDEEMRTAQAKIMLEECAELSEEAAACEYEDLQAPFVEKIRVKLDAAQRMLEEILEYYETRGLDPSGKEWHDLLEEIRTRIWEMNRPRTD